MNFHECLSYLEQVQTLGMKFGLDNVKAVLGAMDSPQTKYPTVIVAGSNGKGSVCAMLTRILSLQEARAGLYTSPHLVTPRERIRIGDEFIPEEEFARHLTQIKEVVDELIAAKLLSHPPTYFETMTCLAYQYFAAETVDIAFLEVGMGGRFDATNVVDPLVSVISTISREHQKFLGETLSEIAFEKAGIIKPGIPVVCGVEAGDAYKTILKRAEELNSPFFPVRFTGNFHANREGMVYTFKYISRNGEYSYTPSLPGRHQGKNAAVAIRTAEVLSATWGKLKKETIIQGIETTRWEGRIEIISEDPLIVLDGAHNIEGAQALRAYVDEFLPQPLTLIYAAMRDKSVEEIAEILFPVADRIALTRFPFYKASDPSELKDRIPQEFHPRIHVEPDPFAAFEWGRAFLSEETNPPIRDATETAQSIIPSWTGGSLLIAGSLFLIGEAKKYFSSLLPD